MAEETAVFAIELRSAFVADLESRAGGMGEVYRALDTRLQRTVDVSEFSEDQARFSPDAHWVAYVSDESGRSEIYIQPFPAPKDGGRKTPISREGGTQLRWQRMARNYSIFPSTEN